MSQILISLAAFLFAIAVLVVFHEFGHFWVARKCGVKVLKFSVGFGKTIWRYQAKSGVEYVVGAIPLGGYVRMLDERDADVPESEKKYAFNRKPLWVKFSVVLAGPVFNFIFAIFAYWLMLMIGVDAMVARIGDIAPESIAYHAGMQSGDNIIQVDDTKAATWQSVHRALLVRLGDKEPLNITVQSPDGQKAQYALNLQSWELKGDRPNPLHALGITPYRPPIPPIVAEVVSGSAADDAGILPEDTLLSINNHPVDSWQGYTEIIKDNPNVTLPMSVLRNGQTVQLKITPQLKEADTGEKVGFAGLMVKVPTLPDDLVIKQRYGPIKAMGLAVIKTKDTISMTFQLLGKLLVGKLGLKHISGPIAIAEGAGVTVVVGVAYFLGFLALISISLGVINLLPIPVLDGGHLLFYAIEAITGRPVSEKIQIFGFKIGIFLLIFLMVIAFYNDLVRFI